MEVSSSIKPEVASEDKALKSLLDAFGSAFSLQDIASAFSKAGRDAELAGQILCENQKSPSTHEMHVSNVPLIRHANGDNLKAPFSKRNPVSVGTVSSVIGKDYVWRVVRSNGNPNGTKPLKGDASEFATHMSSALVSKDVNTRTSEVSSRDANLNNDLENFLFEMLGRGFQLERSAIQEVLCSCGYDMKKSLETLLDVTAATLDKKYTVPKGSKSYSKSKTFSSQNQTDKPKIAESFGNSGTCLRQPSWRYEQQKEVLTSLFHARERPDLDSSASAVKSSGRYWAIESVVAEPPKDISDVHRDILTRPRLANVQDEDDAYQILRKAVKEHRDTMKEYYRAATEAFSNGDRARATLLMEKGRYFYNKAREADEESAMKIFETSDGNGEGQDDMSLDLQDHQAREAIKLVKCHLRTLSGIPSMKNLKVMIGNGGRDAEKRKRLITKLLERESIKWTEDEASSTILIRLDEINPQSLSFATK